MNTESNNSDIENKRIINKNKDKLEVEKNLVKVEFVENTGEIDSTSETVRRNFLRTLSHTEGLGKVLTPQKIEGKRLPGRSGSRSDPGVVHIQLEKVTKKRVANVKMDLDKAIAMIPVCTGKKDVAEFINICEIALKDIAETDKPILLKIIHSKLTGNALEVTKYRNLETWAAIKSILEGAFEQKVSERALSTALNAAHMAEGEGVAKFASRIEELYYKLCAASTVGLNKSDAQVVKNQIKKQAMIIFTTGLPDHLYTVLKSMNPDSLEQCFKIATDEELEYKSRIVAKAQETAQNQNKTQSGGNNGEKYTDNNKNQAFNRGGNGTSYQNNRNNNYNNRSGGYRNNNFNRGGYNNYNNRNSGYRQNYNNNYQRDINNQNKRNTGCYTCGKANHIAKDCWQSNGRPNGRSNENAYDNNRNNGARNVSNGNGNRNSTSNQELHCSYCNKVGHEISNCFTKQKNEKNNTKNFRGQPQVGVRLVQEIVQDPQNEFSTSQHD